MTSHTLRPLVWLLAAATAVLLVVSCALLVSRWPTRAVATPMQPAPMQPAPMQPGQAGPVLERHGVRVPLPPVVDLLGPGERLYYAGEDGRPVVSVRGAAVLVPEACPHVPGSSRGFVAVVRSTRPVRSAHPTLVEAWREGLAGAVGAPPRALRVDVEEGVRTDLVAPVRRQAPCQPGSVRASLLTLPGPGAGRSPGRAAGAVTVVLVRDVGAPDQIGDGTAERLLAGVQWGETQSLRSRT